MSFAGEGSGAGELSWGQLDVWLKMRRLGRTFAMGGARPLPPGSTVDDVAGELAYLMGRYQSMRTRFEPTAGDGPPRQVVHERGTIDLEIVAADPEDVARRFRTTPSTTPTSGRCGWPPSSTVTGAPTPSSSCRTWSSTAPARS
ncbi:hypothetical protein GCM10027610_012140 [Dactylosporangium cerinum]